MKNCGEFASPGDAYEPQGWATALPAVRARDRRLRPKTTRITDFAYSPR